MGGADRLAAWRYGEDRLIENPRGLVGRMARLAGLDPERLALWLFARCVVASPDWPDLLAVARRVTPN